MKQVKHWQDPVSVALGAWLIISPWVLGFQDVTYAMWSAVATGIVLGIAGAIAYSFKSDRDLREVFETTKSDIENADFDEMGKQLEARISEMQATLEERINEVKANAQPVLDGAGEQIDAAVSTATEAINKARGKADSAGDDLADAAGDAVDDAADTATDLVEDAQNA